MSEQHWSARREGGGRLAIWLFRAVGLKCGRGAARLLLYPATLYFFLRRGYERRVSYAFLERAFGRRPSAWQVLRHFHRFGGTMVDRMFLLSDRYARFDVGVHGLDALVSRLQPERGLLLLGAHVGSFEALRVLAAERPDVKVCALLDTQKTPALTELLHELNPAVARNVIDASRPGTEIVLALGEALNEGALVTLLADRAREGESTVVVDFMGAPAAFPTAPFLIGSLLKVPVGAVSWHVPRRQPLRSLLRTVRRRARAAAPRAQGRASRGGATLRGAPRALRASGSLQLVQLA